MKNSPLIYMSQTERLAFMQQLLHSKGQFNQKDVIERFEISRATFKRDVMYFRDRLNAPLVWDKAGLSYKMTSDGVDNSNLKLTMPTMWFSTSEVLTILIAHQILDAMNFKSGLVAVAKIKKDLCKIISGKSTLLPEALNKVMLVRLGQRESTTPNQLQNVVDAALKSQCLAINYHARHDDNKSQRVISPQKVLYYKDNWYLLAWCHVKKGLRYFAVERIKALQNAPHKYFKVSAKILDKELSTSYGIFSGKNTLIAHLKFSALASRWVAEQTWHPKQKTWFVGKEFHMQFPYADDRELLGDILRHGGEVQVMGPQSLRQRVLDAVKRVG